jgi:hypothetical protein
MAVPFTFFPDEPVYSAQVNAASPDLKGRLAGRVGAGTAITNFLNPPLWTPFTIVATGARTITESATLVLNGAPASLALSSGDSITFAFSGTVSTEVGRKVG